MRNEIIAFSIIIILLLLAKNVSYLFFHISIELFTLIVSVSIFIFMWNARKITKNNYLLYISIVYLFVGFINFFHILTYKGTGALPGVIGANIPTQLWIAQRWLLSISLLIAPLFLKRKFNEVIVLIIYSIITALILSTIFYWKIFPASYIDGVGLTNFKKISEYIIVLFFTGNVIMLYRLRDYFDRNALLLLNLSFILNIIAELLFTLYIGVYDIFNMLGHFSVLFSYYFIYKAIIIIGLAQPYNLLFRELEELNNRKDEFIRVASHELKNPLTSIKAYAQLLYRYLVKRKDYDQLVFAVKIQDQTDKITKLVNDLLDVAKIESGKLTYNYSVFDINTLVDSIIKDFQATAKKYQFIKEGKIRIKVLADKDRISQVLNNLINNAIKYSPNADKIVIGIKQTKNKVTLWVQDFGIGISKARLNRVFDRYYRTPGGEKLASGLGLGLYIASQIIKNHHGQIWVESQKYHGSTFYISLKTVST